MPLKRKTLYQNKVKKYPTLDGYLTGIIAIIAMGFIVGFIYEQTLLKCFPGGADVFHLTFSDYINSGLLPMLLYGLYISVASALHFTSKINLNARPARNFVIILSIFSLIAAGKALNDAALIKDSGSKSNMVEIYPNEGSLLKVDNPLKMITSNEKDFLFYDNIKGALLIAPKDDISLASKQG